MSGPENGGRSLSLKYTNNTEDSVYLERSILYMDVTQDGTDGQGLVCDGARFVAEDWGWGYHLFSSSLETNDGPLYMAHTIPEGQRSMDKWDAANGVQVFHKAADEEDYGGLAGNGPTCGGAGDLVLPPNGAWDLAVPGWFVLTQHDMTWWEPQSISCEVFPCQWTERD